MRAVVASFAVALALDALRAGRPIDPADPRITGEPFLAGLAAGLLRWKRGGPTFLDVLAAWLLDRLRP